MLSQNIHDRFRSGLANRRCFPVSIDSFGMEISHCVVLGGIDEVAIFIIIITININF